MKSMLSRTSGGGPKPGFITPIRQEGEWARTFAMASGVHQWTTATS
jgi:hypothetical protein